MTPDIIWVSDPGEQSELDVVGDGIKKNIQPKV